MSSEVTGTIVSAIIGSVSAIVTLATIISAYLKVRNSKNITLIRKDGSKLKVHTEYNRSDSRKMIEFIK